jgi:SsrA-binding protein
MKIIAKNKRASYDYELLEKFEAGLVLVGTEVKSLRLGKVSIKESFISIDKGMEAWIHGMLIAPYSHGNQFNHPENRRRKLLLSKKQIEQIHHDMKSQSLTIVPTVIYFKKSYVKIEVALAKGKKHYDKRAAEAKKDVEKKLRRGQYE